MVATHDTEFAAAFADRVVLMGQGEVIADGTPAEVLAGGWHFSTEVARVLGGAGGALTPEQGAAVARAGAGDVSWQVASFAVLALVLAAGFAWYERRRPPARVVALVAALAALAVVGRLAFAAIPNVKPTTDIVLFAGLRARRGARLRGGRDHRAGVEHLPRPGPVDGVADGGVGRRRRGRRGAGAPTRGRELGRVPLALACGAGRAGLRRLHGRLPVDPRRRQDLATYLAVSGTSLPYNLAHAIGNVVFCLLIGPAFIRALRRYRRRFEVRWQPAAAAAAARCCCWRWSRPGRPERAHAAASPAAKAARYLERAQNRDGGFGARAGPALEPAAHGLGRARPGRRAAQPARRGAAGRQARDRLPARRAGRCATSASSSARSWCSRPRASRRAASAGATWWPSCCAASARDGSWNAQREHTAFGILALRGGGAPGSRVGAEGRATWCAAQNPDGGFGLRPRARRRRRRHRRRAPGAGRRRARQPGGRGGKAVAYLRAAQNPDGGFGQMRAAASNAQSTAWAVQGLVAVGVGPTRGRRTRSATSSGSSAATATSRYSRDQRPDAGLGDRPGAHGAAPQAVPAGHRAAQEAAEEAACEEGRGGKAQGEGEGGGGRAGSGASARAPAGARAKGTRLPLGGAGRATATTPAAGVSAALIAAAAAGAVGVVLLVQAPPAAAQRLTVAIPVAVVAVAGGRRQLASRSAPGPPA